MTHADFPHRFTLGDDKVRTVKDVIEELQKFDQNLQVVVAYDGRYAHTPSFGFELGEGRDLFNWSKQSDGNPPLLIIDA